MTRGLVLLLGFTVGIGMWRPAAAQQVGDPVPTVAMVLGTRAVLITTPCTDGAIPAYWVKPYGGMTILASASPGGAILAALPIPWPNPDPGPESGWCPGTIVAGPPPGTYYVLMVYGLTSQTSAPASAWQQVVVGTRTCTSPPLPPLLVPGFPFIDGTYVAVGFTGPYQGCTTDRIDLEVGTTPGASDIGVFPLPGLNTFFPSVPPGTYYTRARGVNAYGRSNRSTEIPLRIPGPCGLNSLPPTPVNPTVTVNGSQVTLAWTLSPPAGATFHQLSLYDQAGIAQEQIILPSATSVTAPSVPPGNYRVRISSGNACGMTAMVPLSTLDFTVP